MPRKRHPISKLVDSVIAAREQLRTALAEYEATGDHNHGNGAIVGDPTGRYDSDDCWACNARRGLRALESGLAGGRG